MARIVCVVNQKGGVGKTTTAVNLSASIAVTGQRVLLLDLDPQGNASSAVGYPKDRIELSVYDALLGDIDVIDCIRPTEITTLFVLPSNMDLVGAEVELIGVERREFRLKKLLEPLASQYDYIFIDCPPGLGMLTLNALAAAHGVIVPMQAEYFAMEGLSALLSTIDRVRQSLNPALTLDGIVFCMYDPRTNLSVQVRSEVAEHMGDRVFETSIPRNVRLSEAPSHGKPAVLYDLRCIGSQKYMDLAREYLQRSQNNKAASTTRAA
jgi:chromosome partitioning protein